MTIRNINILLLFVSLMMTACGTRKCQQPATERFTTIVDQPWRLAETTSTAPSYRNLSNTTFLVFDFSKNYKGSVKKVENNTEYQNPVITFNYNIDPDSKMIRAEFLTAPSQDSTSQQAVQSTGTIVDFDYELGRELELTDVKTGAYYRFVPYTGIITPDEKCSF